MLLQVFCLQSGIGSILVFVSLIRKAVVADRFKGFTPCLLRMFFFRILSHSIHRIIACLLKQIIHTVPVSHCSM